MNAMNRLWEDPTARQRVRLLPMIASFPPFNLSFSGVGGTHQFELQHHEERFEEVRSEEEILNSHQGVRFTQLVTCALGGAAAPENDIHFGWGTCTG
jgi:hypothetical protein